MEKWVLVLEKLVVLPVENRALALEESAVAVAVGRSRREKARPT